MMMMVVMVIVLVIFFLNFVTFFFSWVLYFFLLFSNMFAFCFAHGMSLVKSVNSYEYHGSGKHDINDERREGNVEYSSNK